MQKPGGCGSPPELQHSLQAEAADPQGQESRVTAETAASGFRGRTASLNKGKSAEGRSKPDTNIHETHAYHTHAHTIALKS